MKRTKLKSIEWIIPHWKFLLSIETDKLKRREIRMMIKEIKDIQNQTRIIANQYNNDIKGN